MASLLSKQVSPEDLFNTGNQPQQSSHIENKAAETVISNRTIASNDESDPLALAASRNAGEAVGQSNGLLVERAAQNHQSAQQGAAASNQSSVTEGRAGEAEVAKPSIPSLKDMKARQEEKTHTSLDSKIMLSSFKAYAPLIAASLYAPGQNADSADYVVQMIEKTSEMTEGLCKMAGIDHLDPDAQWMVSQIRTIAAEHIAQQWRQFVASGKKEFNVNGYLEIFGAINQGAKVQAENIQYPAMSETLRLQMTAMKSIIPVINEFNIMESYMASMFNGYRVDRKVIQKVADEMFNASMEFVNNSIFAPVDDGARLFTLQAMLNHAGTFYASAIAFAVDRLADSMRNLPIKERQMQLAAIAKKNNALIDMAKVNDDFYRNFRELQSHAQKMPTEFAVKSTFITNKNQP